MLLDLYRDAVCGGTRGGTSRRQRLVTISLRNSKKQRDFVMPWALQIFSGGAGLAPEALKKPSDLHAGTVCEAEGGEPSSRQRLVGIIPEVRLQRGHFMVPWRGCLPWLRGRFASGVRQGQQREAGYAAGAGFDSSIWLLPRICSRCVPNQRGLGMGFGRYLLSWCGYWGV